MLFSLGQSLRSLTGSPVATALAQAHRMARRRLADGGAAASARSIDKKPEPADLVLPADVDALAVAKAVRAKLGIAADADTLRPLERRLGGRVVVRARHLLRLGDGRFDLGRAFMHRFISDIRARRTWRRA